VFSESAAAAAGASATSGHDDDHYLYHLVVKYEADTLGLSDNGDAAASEGSDAPLEHSFAKIACYGQTL